MILLEEFLEKIYSEKADGDAPFIWIYEGPDALPNKFLEEGLIAVYKSTYKPKVSFNEKLLGKEIQEIYWRENGIAVAVEERKSQ